MDFDQLKLLSVFLQLDRNTSEVIKDFDDLYRAICKADLPKRRGSYEYETIEFWRTYFHFSESKKCFQIPDAHLGTAIEFSHSGLIRIHGSDGDEFCEWLI